MKIRFIRRMLIQNFDSIGFPILIWEELVQIPIGISIFMNISAIGIVIADCSCDDKRILSIDLLLLRSWLRSYRIKRVPLRF